MSIARHHADWLSLLEVSGPFLSMPVLLDAFPQGLDAYDSQRAGELRAAYEEWADNQGGLRSDPAIHTAWVRYVLGTTLDLPAEVLAEGQLIPEAIKAVIPEHGEVLRPDLVVVEPDGDRRPRLLVQVFPAGQDLDGPLPGSAWKASVATRMMELLHATEVPLGLATNGERWMLVHAPRGETTAFVSWYASLWTEEPLTLRAFHTLLGVERFFNVPNERTLAALLAASARDQHEVTDQLGYQVRQAVEILVQAIDRADQERGGTLLAGVGEARLYETALTVMMRLVFLLAAEERGMLLLGDPTYDQHYAVSTLRAQLREMADRQGEDVLERRYDAWCRLLATFRAVHGGVEHENLRLPAYGGSLFDPDRFPFLEGRVPGTRWRTAPASPLPINNRTVLHLLEALQVLRVQVPGGGPAESRRLSFRALDIEQIGHVYEGLLDHVAVRATEPILGLAGTKDQEPEVPLSALEAFISRQDTKMQSEETLGGLVPWREDIVQFLQEKTGRSASALRRALIPNTQYPISNPLRAERLRAACGNDETLYRRVLPFAGLVRDDDLGFPVVILAGSVYVTAGPTRRATGTHYTPRSLTEPIVQHTLEPLVYIGPAEGLPRDQWKLRSAAELLALKVCDMAMGSGAFLVQVCRYLSERLVEAWDAMLPSEPEYGAASRLRITPDGKPATGDPGETIIPAEPEERLVLARRLVADRCLYGVDKNPLAVEMAKLSLWLITLDKNRSFTFLDHALKHGDSIVGADEGMFLRWAQSLRNSAMPLFDEALQKELATAREKRRELQSFEVREVADAERKAQLLGEAEAAMERVKLGCDLLVGARLLDDLTHTGQDALLANALLDYTAGKPFTDENAERAVAVARHEAAFHWPFEFPEVFLRGGFSSFIGNPPFLGGGRISTVYGAGYFNYLRALHPGSHGQADLCAFFFRRGFDSLREHGALGLIATNTIAQGDTRETGLDLIVDRGEIFSAQPSLPWPGTAAVHVSIVHIIKGSYTGKRILGGKQVAYISPFLDSFSYSTPYTLVQNQEKAFRGMDVLGMGFTISPEEAHELIDQNPQNVDVLYPYINGLDLNNNPQQLPSRWVICFFDWPLERTADGSWLSATTAVRRTWLQRGTVPHDYPSSVAADYPDCLTIVREKVYPERRKNRNKQRREIWWRFTRPRVELFESLSSMKRTLLRTRVTKTHAYAFVPVNMIYSDATVVFAYEDETVFSILQSTLHESWAWQYGSTLKGDLRYSPTDCFETFPLPNLSENDRRNLRQIGADYHEHRQQVMLQRQEGLTAIYNRFHDSQETNKDVVQMRCLHVGMDQAVAVAYGWDDLDLEYGFYETQQGLRYTISERARREVLARLLELNHERYAEEVRQGLHEERGKKDSRQGGKVQRKEKDEQQMSLF